MFITSSDGGQPLAAICARNVTAMRVIYAVVMTVTRDEGVLIIYRLLTTQERYTKCKISCRSLMTDRPLLFSCACD